MLVYSTIFFVLLTLYYLWAILFLRKGLLLLKKGNSSEEYKFSIIIAAHNEEKNIGNCLNHVFDQSLNPDRYEVILVNDRSDDTTAEIAGAFSANHPNLSIISISETPEGVSPKKYALACGVDKSANEIIAYTDADCEVPPYWLECINRHFTPETGLVQGITTYRRSKKMNNIFFGLQSIDFLSHGIVSAGGIGANIPINANANNLAFRRVLYHEIGGYNSVKNIISGDDDLLLQKTYLNRKWKIKYMTDPEGAVTTYPTQTAHGIIQQRKRWGSKTVHYNIRQKSFLAGIFLFYLSLLISFILGFFKKELFISFVSMFAIKILGEYLLLIPGTNIFNSRYLRKYILPASLLQLPVVVYCVISGVFGRFEWKGQVYNRKMT